MKVQAACVHRQRMESVLWCVTFIFVPGHVGDKGNESADSLASIITVADSRALTQLIS